MTNRKNKMPDNYEMFLKRTTGDAIVSLGSGMQFKDVVEQVCRQTMIWQEEWRNYKEQNN